VRGGDGHRRLQEGFVQLRQQRHGRQAEVDPDPRPPRGGD
jgi:hypothetical protein